MKLLKIYFHAVKLGRIPRAGHRDRRAREAAVVSTVLEQASVAATLGTRFKIASLAKRMDDSNDLSSCIDPLLVDKGQAASAGMPVVTMSLKQVLVNRVGESSQPELERMIADGTIPKSLVDPRSHEDRISTWLKQGEELGAIRLF